MNVDARIWGLVALSAAVIFLWPRYVKFRRDHKFGFYELFFIIGLFVMVGLIITALMGKIG